jgi:branched-chain amino acid transport system substrate-binding protein
MRNNPILWAPALLLALAMASPAAAQKNDGPGVSDSEIKLGQTMPFSGPASAYSTIAKAEMAYFAMINDAGGINGRKITLLSLDDGYSPSKTVEQTRRLVEQENVLLDFNPLGTAANTAIQKYLNERKVPQLFVATGATKWGDPEHFPWTMGYAPTYQAEGHIFARYILEHVPDARIAVLYQNDDYGKDYLKGLKDGLGSKAASLIVKEATYEVTDPTVDSQIVSLQASGANVFYDVSGPKFAAQAIRKVYDIGWRPLHLLNSVSGSVGAVLQPAGFERAEGIITATYLKDPTDPQWQQDPAYKDWLAWMRRYYPEGDVTDAANVYGYNLAMTMVQVLKQCGGDVTRENVMRQAAHLDFELPMLLPGVKVSTSPTQYYPIREMQLARFNGKIYERFGEVINSE